jgi:hypothetical protein
MRQTFWYKFKKGEKAARIMEDVIMFNKGFWTSDSQMETVEELGINHSTVLTLTITKEIPINKHQRPILIEGRYMPKEQEDIYSKYKRIKIPVLHLYIYDNKGVVSKWNIPYDKMEDGKTKGNMLKNYTPNPKKAELLWKRVDVK